MEHMVDRRTFVKGSAAVVAGTVATQAGIALASNDSLISVDNVAEHKWTFEVPPAPIANDQIAEVIEADILIIGAGFSGLVTAASASEAGAKVTVVTASDDIVIRGGSMNARGSVLMDKAAETLRMADDAEFMREQLACAGYNVDQKKWWKFINKSPEAMNWLIEMMETAGFITVLERGFEMCGDDLFSSTPGSHSWVEDESGSAGKGSQANVVPVVYQKAVDNGTEFIWSTPVRQLVREDNNTGRVSAAIAQRADGSYIKINARKIVLATGDFSRDHDMMAKYCPEFLPLLDDITEPDYNVGFKFNGLMPGDGQKMGLWIGAAWQRVNPNPPMVLAVGTAGPVNQPCGNHRGLLMNINGERYCNEDTTGVFGNMAQMHQPEMKSCCIWGSNYAEGAAPWIIQGSKIEDGPADPASMLKSWKDGIVAPVFSDVVQADTIEEVIDLLGMPKEQTLATIARYNELCEKGVDEDFGKKAVHMVPILEPPFFGSIGQKPWLLCVGGGLRTDSMMRVCDENDKPIDDLFNVGVMVGDYFANIYNFLIEGNCLGACCLTFGYLTGRALAAGEL
ncbi:MAG: FAD-dependent oxidoreductase [Coriobacteriales bacterium]|nr:FAD-dependent oxidoreductase [Coriobacteriales bacterium]